MRHSLRFEAYAGAAVMLAVVAIGAAAQQVVPPAGYSGDAPPPDVSVPSDVNSPGVTRIPNAALSNLFRVDPAYRREAGAGVWAGAGVKVVGAFAIAEPAGMHFIAAWSPGFLPVTLSFSDGRCYLFDASYFVGTLSNGRLSPVSCEGRRSVDRPPPPPPSDRSLRLIGSPWDFAAWIDIKAGVTIITAPHAKAFEPLFTARMTTAAIMAMNSPDAPAGDITLVGRIDGRLTVVTLEVSY